MIQSSAKSKEISEYGDFQTPAALASSVLQRLHNLGLRPRAVLEPTCGEGAFVVAAAALFPEAEVIVGVEINPSYVRKAAADLQIRELFKKVQLTTADFFSLDWSKIIKAHAGPWLIVGNPPWVTSSKLSALSSDNLPNKSNFHRRTGIEAITGKSNFDISEWMLRRYLDWLGGSGTIAVLCKTAVARKILADVWKQTGVLFSHIYKIDAMAHFGAAVDACLFVISLAPKANCTTCDIYDSLHDASPSSVIAFCKGHLVAGVEAAHLDTLWGPDPHYLWRSGIKHDCARVMELFFREGGYGNGLGEKVLVEEEYLYPMLKGSDIGNGRVRPRGKMIVTQEMIGQPTHLIEMSAPSTWAYLMRHRVLLRQRGSVIYRNKPDFSIFGVGDYSFAPWKLAVSSFYKKLQFVSVGPVDGRSVVFDDTVYFLPCKTEEEARFLERILHSEVAARFLNSMIHWPDKRPLTIDILSRLSLRKLAAALGRSTEYEEFTKRDPEGISQGLLSFN